MDLTLRYIDNNSKCIMDIMQILGNITDPK